MSGSNTSLRNNTYINGGITYVVKSNDDNINVNSALGPTVIYIPNINSHKNFTRKIYINDTGGLAATYPITIACIGGNLINGQGSINLSINGISAEILIVNNNEYLANLSSDDSSPSGVTWGSITGTPSNQTDLQYGTIQGGTFTPVNTAVVLNDSFRSIAEKLQGQINSITNDGWDLGGNNLAGIPQTLGSTDSTDWGLIRGGDQVMTLFQFGAGSGVRFQNGAAQANTGVLGYIQGTGRIIFAADNGSTSGGPIFGFYGTTAGTVLGSPYLNNSFNMRIFSSFVYDAMMATNSGFLLGNSTGTAATARIDIRTFSANNANKAWRIQNITPTELAVIYEGGQMDFNCLSSAFSVTCGLFNLTTGAFAAQINSTLLSATRALQIPDASGIFALTSDIIGTYTQVSSVTSASALLNKQTIEATTGTFAINLYTAIGNTGKEVWVKNTGAGVITVTPFGAETIDGAATLNLITNDGYILKSNGANWIKI